MCGVTSRQAFTTPDMRSGDAVKMTPLRLSQSVVTSRTFHARRGDPPRSGQSFLSRHYFSVRGFVRSQSSSSARTQDRVCDGTWGPGARGVVGVGPAAHALVGSLAPCSLHVRVCAIYLFTLTIPIHVRERLLPRCSTDDSGAKQAVRKGIRSPPCRLQV